MASSHPGYEQQAQEEYNANPGDNSATLPSASAPGKKKRNYAGQAYEFGGGANANLGGQQVGGGQYPPPPSQGQGYGDYGQQPQQQASYPGQNYGSGPASPAFGGPNYGQQPQNVGGYQSPEPAYPAQGGPQHPSVGGITQGMGNMSVGQHAPIQGRNQLYPSDITNSPLNVNELDLPPPPIILPPNVSPDPTLTEGY